MNPEHSFTDVRHTGARASVRSVLDLLAARTRPLGSEAVPVPMAGGRVLAAAVVSTVDVPAFPRAAMDGYAVRAADTAGATASRPVLARIIGRSLPARPHQGQVGPGEAVRITTGAPVPSGADAVVMVEQARLEPDGSVAVGEPVASGKHVVRVGEDVRKGEEVLGAGRWLRPQDLGLLAAIGVGTVEVVRRPRVAILATGNELLPPGSMPAGHSIVDGNSPMLAALVARDGGQALPVRYVDDDPTAIREALQGTCQAADAVLITGGTSVGSEDHVAGVVAGLGELPVHGIAMRPAAPTGIGYLRGPEGESQVPVFLLPGTPVACLCAYDLFAGRVVRRLGGLKWELPYRTLALPLGARLDSAVGRTDYLRVGIREGQVFPVTGGGSSSLSTTVKADGFVLAPEDRDSLPAGEIVEVRLYEP
jgi:molybdopterin molybdotransferase